MNKYVNFFKTSAFINKWFWYKNNGIDKKLALTDTPFDIVLHAADDPSLCTSLDCSTLTPLGSNYLASQDPSFANYSNPRLSFSPPNSATYLGLDQWSNDPNNIGLIWDFSKQSDITAWAMSNYSQFADGVKIKSNCPTGKITKTFSDAERQIIAGTNYFVVERGFQSNSPNQAFQIFYRSIANHSQTAFIEVGSSAIWDPTVNPLAQQGMPDVIEFKKYLPAGNEITQITYKDPISQALCVYNPDGSPNYSYFPSYSYGRAYFAYQNPVPVVVPNGQTSINSYTGPVLIPEIKTNAVNYIPISMNAQFCTACTLTLDANSVSKGMVITDKQFIKWQPTPTQVGMVTGTVTLNANGKTVPKVFQVKVLKPQPALSFLYLLLD